MPRPDSSEYAPFYAGYVGLVPEADVLAVLAAQRDDVLRLAAALPPDRETFRYAPGKWSVRELLGHVGDAERVFGFRAFCFGRGERNPLPGFEENEYVAASGYDGWTAKELAAAFADARAANLAVLTHLAPERWSQVGTASGKPVTVRALAWIMAGHVRHHLGVLRERYGVGA
jgi:hypothetical protein